MERKIDWIKIFTISELITVTLVAIVVFAFVLSHPVGAIGAGAIGDFIVSCAFIMPFIGIFNFLISLIAGVKKYIIALCFIQALVIVAFVVRSVTLMGAE